MARLGIAIMAQLEPPVLELSATRAQRHEELGAVCPNSAPTKPRHLIEG